MTTSGTYNFNPSLGELTLFAFNLAGVRNTAIAQEHMESARMATNLMLSRWANMGVNLWEVKLATIPLTTGVSTYAAAPIDNVTAASGNGTTATLTYSSTNTYPTGSQITVAGMTPAGYNGTFTVTASTSTTVSYANTTTGSMTVAGTITGNSSTTVMVLDSYVTTVSGGSNIDRIILPVSRTEYASYPNKTQQGFPTIYWFDRLISPTVTIWPVPNTTTGPSTLSFYYVTQVQDSNFTGGQTVDVPYRWLDAFANGLAYRLARIWNPPLVQMLKPEADEAYAIAAQQDTEYVSMYVSPQVSGYWRT
jgi:hypothetical protein